MTASPAGDASVVRHGALARKLKVNLGQLNAVRLEARHTATQSACSSDAPDGMPVVAARPSTSDGCVQLEVSVRLTSSHRAVAPVPAASCRTTATKGTSRKSNSVEREGGPSLRHVRVAHREPRRDAGRTAGPHHLLQPGGRVQLAQQTHSRIARGHVRVPKRVRLCAPRNAIHHSITNKHTRCTALATPLQPMHEAAAPQQHRGTWRRTASTHL